MLEMSELISKLDRAGGSSHGEDVHVHTSTERKYANGCQKNLTLLKTHFS